MLPPRLSRGHAPGLFDHRQVEIGGFDHDGSRQHAEFRLLVDLALDGGDIGNAVGRAINVLGGEGLGEVLRRFLRHLFGDGDGFLVSGGIEKPVQRAQVIGEEIDQRGAMRGDEFRPHRP